MGSPGNTPIVDAVSGSSVLTIPAMAPVMPTSGGAGYRTYFNWLIPQPHMVANYRLGAVIDNATDPQLYAQACKENNLAQINFQTFFARAGAAPAKVATAEGDDTTFQHEVRIVNNTGEPSEFEIRIEGIEVDWEVFPENPFPVPMLMPEEETTVFFDVIKHNSAHRDTTKVTFKLFKLPEMELKGGITSRFEIDGLPPLPVDDWDVEVYRPLGDNLIRPAPTGVLSWEENPSDEDSFPERIRFFEIYRGEDPGQVISLDPALLIDETYGDDDLVRPGFQKFIYDEPGELPLFYTVIPVDVAGNRGMPVPAMELVVPPVSNAPVPGAAAFVSQSYPNPFNPMTKIEFSLPRGEHVRVAVRDAAGRLVKVLADEFHGPGPHTLTWNGTDDRDCDVASGIYFLEFKSASLDTSRKMALVR